MGRWSALPAPDTDPTRRAHTASEVLLDRYGIVTRGAVLSERLPGGFAGVYPVLKAGEEAGRTRRGYFIEGLGAAQFALPGAVDRMRAMLVEQPTPPDPDWGTDSGPRGVPVPSGDTHRALLLAATDPANVYGAALPWPDRAVDSGGHRAGRKAGALVVLVDGALVLYIERGGRTLLTFSEDASKLGPAVDVLALAVRDGHLGKLTVEKADGVSLLAASSDDALAEALRAAGFRATPRGLRLRT